MNNYNELFKIYDMLFDYHKKHPQLRFLQIINNFLTWNNKNHQDINDGYYIENNNFIEKFNEFKNYYK